MLKSEMEIDKTCLIIDMKVKVTKISKNVGECLCAICPSHRQGKGKVFIYEGQPIITCLPREKSSTPETS